VGRDVNIRSSGIAWKEMASWEGALAVDISCVVRMNGIRFGTSREALSGTPLAIAVDLRADHLVNQHRLRCRQMVSRVKIWLSASIAPSQCSAWLP